MTIYPLQSSREGLVETKGLVARDNSRLNMYFDLNVPVLATGQPINQPQSKKSKGKQPQAPSSVTFTPPQLAGIENRVDLFVHCPSSSTFLIAYG